MSAVQRTADSARLLGTLAQRGSLSAVAASHAIGGRGFDGAQYARALLDELVSRGVVERVEHRYRLAPIERGATDS